MKIATWNVNSVRARIERVLGFLSRHSPDVLCLQELKTPTDAFPFDALRAAGYHAAVHGQKTYNGVAILAREEPADVVAGFADGTDDPQSRLIAATVAGVRIMCVYVPNGSEVGSEKWAYKLAWLGRLRKYLDKQKSPLALCGDFNVAPDDLDVAHPEDWADSVLCHSTARAALEDMRAFGLRDVFREKNPAGGIYSWWDYRMLAFPRNNGLRIDHIFATPALADRCTAAFVDRDERKGTGPSDHAPVLAEFKEG